MHETGSPIPYYKEINDFLESLSPDFRTSNPFFYCLEFKEGETRMSNYKPPFRKDFYFIGLVTNAGKTKISYDNKDVVKLNSFLVFQAPGLLYSFFRDNTASGYLIYFKSQCFPFLKPDFEKEFPFFDILHTSFFKLDSEKFNVFAPVFEEVFTEYKNSSDDYHTIAAVKLLALLYKLKEFTIAFNLQEQNTATPQQLLLKKFIQLVNTSYIEKRTVEEYAETLCVTPNHLSQSVKAASGKNALVYVSERIMTEARALIQHTALDIAEISHQLNFSDPANFGKFFKKNAGFTPLEFRKQAVR